MRSQWIPSGIAQGLVLVAFTALVEEAIFHARWHKDTPPVILVTVCVAMFAGRLWRAFRKAKFKRQA